MYSSGCSFLYDGCLEIKRGDGEWESMHSVLSVLSYMLKAPLVPPGTPIVNALFAQRQCIVNLFRACVGLPPDNHMSLEHKRGVADTTTNPDLPGSSASGTKKRKMPPVV